VWAWLSKVESMGRSAAVYVPIVLLNKACTYGRVILLTWLIGTVQFGVWQLGVMVFSVMASVATLGAGQGVARYVSHYQARGQLRRVYRRAMIGIVALALGTTGLAALAAGPIADLLAGARDAGQHYSRPERLDIVAMALLNGLFMALYLNLQSCIRALRTFRLLAAVDLGYTLTFTALALAGAAWTHSGYAVLVAHAGSLALMVGLGGLAAIRLLRGAGAAEAATTGIEAEGDLAAPAPAPVLRRLLTYGGVSMLATLMWQVGNQTSAFFTNRYHSGDDFGVYTAFRQLCQPVWVLSGVIWGLVFSHVASHWERGDRPAAVRMVNLTYKSVVLALTTISVAVLATAPWWQLLLGRSYRLSPAPGGRDLMMLAGLLMFFQCSANLGIASIAAKLRERPIVVVIMAGVGVAANAALARAWVPAGGVCAAARAAGWGMWCACAVGAAYLLMSGFKAHPAVYLLSLSPAVLMLPLPASAAVWAAVLLVAAGSRLVFSPWEKRVLWAYVRSFGGHRTRGAS